MESGLLRVSYRGLNLSRINMSILGERFGPGRANVFQIIGLSDYGGAN